MPADLITLNLAAVAFLMGSAWKLSRDITTLQVQVATLTESLRELKADLSCLRSPE